VFEGGTLVRAGFQRLLVQARGRSALKPQLQCQSRAVGWPVSRPISRLHGVRGRASERPEAAAAIAAAGVQIGELQAAAM